MYTEIFKFALISTLITAASGLVMFLFAREDVPFQDLYNEALSEYKEQNFKKAITLFEKAIAKNPSFVPALYNLALCYFKMENFDMAMDFFIKVLDLSPDDTDTIQNMGLIELKKSNYVEALSFFKKSLEISSEDAECLFNMSFVYKNLEQFSDAIDAIEKAITISPENLDYKQYFLDLLSESPELDINPDLQNKFLSTTLYLLDIYPNDEKLIFDAGTAYSKLGDWENSIIYYERAIETNPRNVLALNQYALVLLCKGELEKSIEAYENSIKIDPSIPDTYLNLAFAYEKCEQDDNAKEMFELFIAKFPDNPGVDIAREYLCKNSDESENMDEEISEDDDTQDRNEEISEDDDTQKQNEESN